MTEAGSPPSYPGRGTGKARKQRPETLTQHCTAFAISSTLTPIAQFIAVCSWSILAETLGYAVSFSSPWRGKHRVLEWCKPVLMDQLQPSTNADKLSDPCIRSICSRSVAVGLDKGLIWRTAR